MTPTTVKVPKDIEPLFAQAEAVVSNYFARIKQDPTQGTIEIGGERYVLVRGAALSVEFFALVRNLFGPGNEAQADEFSRNILFDLAHAVGKSDAENFHKRLNLTDPIAKLSAGPVHFSHTGWAFVEIFPESHPTPDQDYYLIYDHPYSFEADAWLKHGGQSEAPVCVMNAGYASGWCEASFGVPLVAAEMLCRAKGDPTCRFIMAPPDRIAEHVERYLHQRPDLAPRMKASGIPEFFARKRMEEELRQSEEQYRAIFNATTDGLVIFNVEGFIADVNPRIEALTGYRREELVGMYGADLIHPDHDYPALFADFKKQLMTFNDYQIELTGRRKNGSYFPVEVRGTLLHYKGAPHLLALVQDITERKKAEEEVQKLASVVRYCRELVGLATLDGRIIFLNEAGGRILGIPPAEAQRYKISDVVPEERKIRFENEVLPALMGEGSWEGDAQYRNLQSGEVTDVHATIFTIRDPQTNKPLFLANVSLDISDRKRSERELQTSAEALTRANQALAESARIAQAANNAKTLFLANMSHEIRTPLNAILGFTALLRQNTDQLDPAEQHDYLDTIHVSGQHLLGLINDVLDLSKIESDALDLHLIPYSPAEAINEVVSALWVRAAEKRISLESHWVGPVPQIIHTDPSRLRQMLLNLVANAVKFTKRGGVAVVARIDQDGPEPLLAVEISDTGVGIPADKLQVIFEPFIQADSSITREFTGTGLGLTISRRIAETLGGSISVVSRVGRGSTFTVKIPIGPLEESPPPSPENTTPLRYEGLPEMPPRLDSVRILVVEDVEANQRMVRLFLKRAGALVETAENGEVALDRVAQQSFDLIFMDMQMPVMDGYTATCRLRQQGLTIPIIALTAHAMDGDEGKCREAGCSGYLSKPIDPARLIKAATEALAACPAGSASGSTSSTP